MNSNSNGSARDRERQRQHEALRSRQPPPPTPQQAVESAQRVIAELDARRNGLVERGAELAEQRRSAAYSAHVQHDHEARLTLDQVNAEVATHASELQSVDDALVTARERLQQAQRAEALAADREQAKALRAAVREFHEAGVRVDHALGLLARDGHALLDALRQVHALGCAFPSSAQMESLGNAQRHHANAVGALGRDRAAEPAPQLPLSGRKLGGQHRARRAGAPR